MLRVTDEEAIASGTSIQPYLGLGFTVSTLDVDSVSAHNATTGALIGTSGSGDSATDVGFAFTGGLNYLITNNVKIYSEYSFGTVDYEFNSLDGLKVELNGQGSAIMFGASYSF